MNKLIVLEVNEISLEVISTYCQCYPASRLASYLQDKRFTLTIAADQPEEFLYPTQTWASMNTGKPFAEHKIKWFNDYKNYQDFYWARIAAAGHATVLISSLHTSPLHKFLHTGNYKAVIPDFFAEDNDTFPKKYQALQTLNRELSFANRRNSSKKQTLLTAGKHFLAKPLLANWGLGRHSIKDLIPLLTEVTRNPEALRKCQFPLLMQIFLNELKQHRPVLSIVGTNHIASAMHRYLHAMPDLTEKTNKAYPNAWLDQYRNEVVSAVHLLDRWLILIEKFAAEHNYALVIASSMGQKINQALNPNFIKDYRYDFRLKYPEKFFAALNVDFKHCKPVGAMLPQYAFRARNIALAQRLEQQLQRFLSDPKVERYGHYVRTNQPCNTGIPIIGVLFNIDRNQDVITITTMLNQQQVKIGDQDWHYKDLGFERFPVNDHHSGTHSKQGVMLYNSKFAKINPQLAEQMDYLEVAELLTNTVTA